jgi:hypothetical protein
MNSEVEPPIRGEYKTLANKGLIIMIKKKKLYYG